MNKHTAANISIILALLLWPMALIIFSVMLNEHEPNARGVILAGIMIPFTWVILVIAAWLAGYSYTDAKKRAIFSTLCCVSYVIVFAWLFWK